MTFDKPDRGYLPGEEVKCTWRVRLRENKSMRSMYVLYEGAAETKWTESKTVRENGKSKTQHTIYRGEQNYFTHLQTLYGMKDGPEVMMPAGEHTYNTTFILPNNIPQTFGGKIMSLVCIKAQDYN